MNLFKLINISFIHSIKIFSLLVIITSFNIANASSSVMVRIEDMGLSDWTAIQKYAPGFGSSGPISLNWDPNHDFFTELLAWNDGYSRQGAAFCWYGESCALALSVTAENTLMKLDSFSIGYYGYGGTVTYSVIDLANETSILSGKPWVDGNVSTLISVNAASDSGFLILFGPDGFNGGINNIAYSYQAKIVPTPLPTAVWFFGSGLMGFIGFSRRSKV